MAKQAVKSGGARAGRDPNLSEEAYGNAPLMASVASEVMPLPPVTNKPAKPVDESIIKSDGPDPLAVPTFDDEETAAGFGDRAPSIPPDPNRARATQAESLWRNFAMPGSTKEAPWVSGQQSFDQDYDRTLAMKKAGRKANVRRVLIIAVALLVMLGAAGYWSLAQKEAALTDKDLGNLDSTRGKLVIIDSPGSVSGTIALAPKASEAPPKPKAPDNTGSALVQKIVADQPTAPPPPVANTAPPVAPLSGGPAPILSDSVVPLPPAPGYKSPVLARIGEVPFAPLPAAAPGSPAWTANGRHFDGDATVPRVALIVSGLGLDRVITETIIARLPVEVSVAFSPYAQDLDAQIASARAHGHEVFLEMPMEPVDFPARDAGPLALMPGNSSDENSNRLKILLTKAGGCAGFLGETGGKALQSSSVMQPLARELASRGLLWVQPPRSPILATGIGGPTVAATLEIDQLGFGLSTGNRLEYLTKVARQQGTALGIARPTPGTLVAILRWAETLKAAGVVLTPATATVTSTAGPAGSPPARAG